jgi:hypothetical protein
MQEKINELIAAFEASLDDGTATPESLQQAVAEIEALVSITELDRFYHLNGTVRLLDAVLNRVAPDEGVSLREQRARIAGILERQFGSPNAPYARSRDIVQEAATRLKGGENADADLGAAVAELNALPFAAEDAAEQATALLAVHALRAATVWLAGYDESPNKLDPLPFSLKLSAAAFELGGFDNDWALKSVTHIRDNRLSLDGTTLGYMTALMVSVGLALRAEPMALPALAQPLAWLAEALNEVQAEAAAQATPVSAIAAQCEAAVAQFERDLEAHGFTEYHLRQAMAALQELPSETPADPALIRDAILRLIDVALPHAPREFAEMLPIIRQQIVAQGEPAGPPIDVVTFEVEGQRIVERLRAALAGGTYPSAAFVQAGSDLQALGSRVPDDDNDKDKDAFVRAMLRVMPELVAAMEPYAESGKEVLAADTVDMMRRALADMEGVIDDDKAKAELAGRAALQHFQSMLNQPLGDPFEHPDAPLYQRQFVALERMVVEQTMRLKSDGVLAGRDATEFERIESRLKVAFDRLRAAATEAQWIDQQRGALRSAVTSLRRFERRHHLMVIAPPWTAARLSVNANAVFVSGGSTVQSLVDAASRALGYEAPIALGVNDPTHARWDRLSRSAIAVFDFTSYDRAAADPQGDIPSSPAAMVSIAQTAAPTALVAYECGWAFVLGVPMVIVAREGQAVPFDIDVEPVRLAGDATDADRVGLALQAALFGTQRGVFDEGLSRTLDYLKSLAARDATAARLIDAAGECADATSVRLAAEGVLERLSGRGLMLALPAFPPAYPPDAGRKALFHVTAFRPWSEACQRVVRDACGDALERRIGYEQFDPDIIRNIWNDLATASYVVADLTHLNPNAALELAIAQALGRPTLVVSQTPNLHAYLPPLAKVRIHTYTTDAAGLRGLRAAVDRLIAG